MGSLGRKHGFAADHVQRRRDRHRRRPAAPRSAPTPSPSCSGPSAAARATSASSPRWRSSWCRSASLFAGGIFFAGDDAPAVLHAFREWAPTLPEEVSTSIAIMRLPDMEELPPPLRGQTVVHLRYAYSGDRPRRGRAAARADEGAGHDPARLRRADPDRRDGRHPHGPGRPDAGVGEGHAARRAAPRRPSTRCSPPPARRLDIPLIMVEIRLMGGALARPAEGAERGRRPRRRLLGATSSARRSRSWREVVPAIGKGVLGALAPWKAPGSMINFLGDVSGPEEVAAAYPAGVVRAAARGQDGRRPGRRLLLRPRHLRARATIRSTLIIDGSWLTVAR